MFLDSWGPCVQQVNKKSLGEEALSKFGNFRQNTRLYDLKGQGSPEDWSTEEGQGEEKVMVFHAIYGEVSSINND